MDLVDFSAHYIAKAELGREHPFYRHHELVFDVRAGRADFRNEVNELFRRQGVAFHINEANYVERAVPVEMAQFVDQVANTGDETLDGYLTDAMSLIRSRAANDREQALRKLVDAFERLKTVDYQEGKTIAEKPNKKELVARLLDQVAPPAAHPVWRGHLDQESRNLTEIANTMQIRHSETYQEPLQPEGADYLFTRYSAFVFHILRQTGRLT